MKQVITRTSRYRKRLAKNVRLTDKVNGVIEMAVPMASSDEEAGTCRRWGALITDLSSALRHRLEFKQRIFIATRCRSKP